MSNKNGSDFVTWDDLCQMLEGRGAIKGERGDRGEAGDKGDRGEKGEQGNRGDKGEKGDRGDEGRQGKKGDKGEKGNDGLKGDRGCTGDKGDRGDKGERGEKGEEGCQGKQGDRGIRGDQGDKGDRGEKGDKGDKGEQGDRGEQGDKGATGAQGNPGAKGDPGAPGAKGDSGLPGNKGDTGAAGTAATQAQIDAAVANYFTNNPDTGGAGLLTELTKEADPENPCRQRLKFVFNGNTFYGDCFDPDKECCTCGCLTASETEKTATAIGMTVSGATIDWGDGSTPTTVAGGTFSEDHTYADAGEYKISICLEKYCDVLSNWDITGGVNVEFGTCQSCG